MLGSVSIDGLEVCSPADRPLKVLQFGEGNFLRAFVDWMLDSLNERGLFDGSIAIVQPIPRGRCAALAAQDCLYTVALNGMQAGEMVRRLRIVTSVSEAFDGCACWSRLVELAAQADLRFVVSNTTEAGIVYVPQPFTPQAAPETFPAKVAAWLYARYQAFDGADEAGLVFLPVELIESNGRRLRECILRHADDWGLDGGFARWVGRACVFCNTLVDRIVTGYPADGEAWDERLGYHDENLVTAEPFALWAIEAPPHVQEELPFALAGLNVVWTDDLTPYRMRKVRLLNGAHTVSVLAAFHAGLDTVAEMMGDDLTGAYVRRAVYDEILPILDGLSPDDNRRFADAVIERFANPFVHHRLLDISLNSVSKWPIRVAASLREYVDRFGALPDVLAFSMAALLWFYRGRNEGDQTFGRRDATGDEYEIRDDLHARQVLSSAWASTADYAWVAGVLSDRSLWSTDLATIGGLTQRVQDDLAAITATGMRTAMARRLGTPQ